MRWVLSLSGMSEPDGEKFGIDESDRKWYVRADLSKANYAPPQPTQWLKRRSWGDEGGILEHVELTALKSPKPKKNSLRAVGGRP
jgi:hypothetical protein